MRDPGVYISRCFHWKTGERYTPYHPDIVPDPQKVLGLKKQTATGNVYVPVSDFGPASPGRSSMVLAEKSGAH
eukprot:54330-Pyramimonas_sp.AAC.1